MKLLVRNHDQNIKKVGDVRILPGVSQLTEAQFSTLKKYAETNQYPAFNKMLDDGVLEIPGFRVSAPKKVEESGAYESEVELDEADADAENALDKLNARQAVELVKDTTDSDLLELWKIKENRSTVTKAIDDQMKLLADEPKADDNEGED